MKMAINKGVDFKLLEDIKKILKENLALFPSEIARILNKNADKIYVNKVQRYIKKYIKSNKSRNILLEELKISSKCKIKTKINNGFKLSLEDLPENRIYVGITDSLNKRIIEEIGRVYGSYYFLSKKVEVNHSSLHNWVVRKEYPLIIIKKIIKKIGIKSRFLERNITYLKSGCYPARRKQGGNLSKPVFPKFPIILSEELARVIAHFFADGCVGIDKKQYITPAYYNNNKELRRLFKEDIREIFGDIYFKEAINKTTHYIALPTPIGLILLQICDTFDSKKGKIPEFIINHDLNLRKEFIKAFFDDEAYVRYEPPLRYIELTLSNYEFVKDLKEMLTEFGINSTKITRKLFKGRFLGYSFYIRNYENLKKFYDMIKFNHTKKKEALTKIMKDPGRLSYARNETKGKIVTLLNKTPLTSTELSKLLNRKRCTISYFINKLKGEGKVFRVGVEGKHIVWGIKNDL